MSTKLDISLYRQRTHPDLVKLGFHTPIEAWKYDYPALLAHLEKLKENKFIQYDNITAVMSGKKVAVFIEHKTYKATNKNAVYLFKVWYDLNLIDKSLFL